ncbi:uncharacterized protein LOC125942617 isoform X2 [Dermacentor silvarum]|uniref:uncharacterized protein LOC125942617 isoform X2 n=1 Tax=Dermacentor silvarum TaxID=543639 RepID=UPI002101758F|nr:uncharacterized protein LOC125942617 isoform X2 [Dermacentor silvarum]
MAETEEMVLHTSKRLRNLSLEKGKSTKGIITAMASMAPLSQEHADMDIFTGEAIDVVIGSSRDDGKASSGSSWATVSCRKTRKKKIERSAQAIGAETR